MHTYNQHLKSRNLFCQQAKTYSSYSTLISFHIKMASYFHIEEEECDSNLFNKINKREEVDVRSIVERLVEKGKINHMNVSQKVMLLFSCMKWLSLVDQIKSVEDIDQVKEIFQSHWDSVGPTTKKNLKSTYEREIKQFQTVRMWKEAQLAIEKWIHRPKNDFSLISIDTLKLAWEVKKRKFIKSDFFQWAAGWYAYSMMDWKQAFLFWECIEGKSEIKEFKEGYKCGFYLANMIHVDEVKKAINELDGYILYTTDWKEQIKKI